MSDWTRTFEPSLTPVLAVATFDVPSFTSPSLSWCAPFSRCYKVWMLTVYHCPLFWRMSLSNIGPSELGDSDHPTSACGRQVTASLVSSGTNSACALCSRTSWKLFSLGWSKSRLSRSPCPCVLSLFSHSWAPNVAPAGILDFSLPSSVKHLLFFLTTLLPFFSGKVRGSLEKIYLAQKIITNYTFYFSLYFPQLLCCSFSYHVSLNRQQIK